MQTSSRHQTDIKQTLNNHKAGSENESGCFVYILLLSNRKYYTGMTVDLKRRLTEHKNGQSKSTQRYLPFKLMYYVFMQSSKEARWLEKKIKNRGAERYLRIRITKKNLREIEKIIDLREAQACATSESFPI